MDVSDFIGIFILLFYLGFMYLERKLRSRASSKNQPTQVNPKSNIVPKEYSQEVRSSASKSMELKTSPRKFLEKKGLPLIKKRKINERKAGKALKFFSYDSKLSLINAEPHGRPKNKISRSYKSGHKNDARINKILKQREPLSNMVIYSELLSKAKSLRTDQLF